MTGSDDRGCCIVITRIGKPGRVGGKEDELDSGDGGLTSPDDAAYFAEKAGIDFLEKEEKSP